MSIEEAREWQEAALSITIRFQIVHLRRLAATLEATEQAISQPQPRARQIKARVFAVFLGSSPWRQCPAAESMVGQPE